MFFISLPVVIEVNQTNAAEYNKWSKNSVIIMSDGKLELSEEEFITKCHINREYILDAVYGYLLSENLLTKTEADLFRKQWLLKEGNGNEG